MLQKIKDILLGVLALLATVFVGVLFIFRDDKEEKGEAKIKVSNPDKKGNADKADTIGSAISRLDSE